MSKMPDSRTISEKLSEVLGDIGITEKIVLKRRRAYMLMETIDTIFHRLQGNNIICFTFGSQSEGSTTPLLCSDIDTLSCYLDLNVIQDLSEQIPGAQNVLMVQDETTSPGYCLLQRLRPDSHPDLTINDARLDKYFIDEKGRVFLKNTYPNVFYKNDLKHDEKNGPAHVYRGEPHNRDEDHVTALYCKSWPKEAKPWLAKQGIGMWPTEEVKRYCETEGCFLVPVSSKSGRYEELEWRISTSLAERRLMFSLNITQMRCYVLMKMILKKFINPNCSGVISSYMCKTVLFDCIQNTNSSEWVESNLLECFRHCLFVLQNFVIQGNCPHFIIPENNLLDGKISEPVKHGLSEILHFLRHSGLFFLLKIPTDYLGWRLFLKMPMLPNEMRKIIGYPLQWIGFLDFIQSLTSKNLFQTLISAQLLRKIAAKLSICHKYYLRDVMNVGNEIAHSRSIVFTLVRRYGGTALKTCEKSAYTLVLPFLCSSLASAIASHDLDQNKPISPVAKAWFSAGLYSDVSSGRLKFASALYCSGDMSRTERILQSIEQMYDTKNVETICSCDTEREVKHPRQGFKDKSNTGNEELIKYNTSFCVKFLPCERKCVPHELQYEMYRSTQEDMLHRHKFNDYWMNWAVVDSLPYLYFLKYKIYGRLRKPEEQQKALTEFKTTLDTENNISHKETALNLLGQCMEQENCHTDALNYYIRSLKIRERNNAANIHICRILSVLTNKRVLETQKK